MTACSRGRQSCAKNESLNLVSAHADIPLVIPVLSTGNRLWTPKEGFSLLFPDGGCV